MKNSGIKVCEDTWMNMEPDERDRSLYRCVQSVSGKVDKIWWAIIVLLAWSIGKGLIPAPFIKKAIAFVGWPLP